MTKELQDRLCIKFFYDEKGGYVSVGYLAAKSGLPCSIARMNDKLYRILGFEGDYGYDLLRKTIRKEGYNINVRGRLPASLARAIPDQLFVYSNICEPGIVGDTFAPLLRIVNIDAKQYNFGSTVLKKYTPVSYVPLITNRFQTIDIDIRDQYGQPVAFEYGTLTVVLRFRRRL